MLSPTVSSPWVDIPSGQVLPQGQRGANNRGLPGCARCSHTVEAAPTQGPASLDDARISAHRLLCPCGHQRKVSLFLTLSLSRSCDARKKVSSSSIVQRLKTGSSSRPQWFMPVIPALREAKVGELLEARSPRPAWATQQDPVFAKILTKQEKLGDFLQKLSSSLFPSPRRSSMPTILTRWGSWSPKCTQVLPGAVRTERAWPVNWGLLGPLSPAAAGSGMAG